MRQLTTRRERSIEASSQPELAVQEAVPVFRPGEGDGAGGEEDVEGEVHAVESRGVDFAGVADAVALVVKEAGEDGPGVGGGIVGGGGEGGGFVVGRSFRDADAARCGGAWIRAGRRS